MCKFAQAQYFDYGIMNTKHKIQSGLKPSGKAVSLLTKAIAKILLKFRIIRSDFILSLDEQLVLEAKKQDPDASIVTLAIRTGIDRRYIGKYLKGDMPQPKPDRLAVILEDIHWTSHKFYNSTIIPITGPFRTFQSICEQRASGTLTYKAILQELINNGNLKLIGTNRVELILLKSSLTRNKQEYTKFTALQINRTVNTLIYNFDTKISKDKFVQRTIFSTQINPTQFNILHDELKSKTDIFRNEINSLMMSYEEDVNIGTHPEYGYSFLEYKIEKKS